MKAKIYISEQIGGNYTIAQKLHGYTSKMNGMFNSLYFYYDTIGAARNDLEAAYRSIIQDNENNKEIVYLSKDKKYLSYDASKAEIIKEE